MEKIFLILFCSVFFSCESQERDKKLINSFVNDIIFTNEYEFKELNRYIIFDDKILKDDVKKKFMIELIDSSIVELKANLKSQDNSYKILTHKELLKNNIYSNFKYHDYSKVYYLLIDNKITNPFIIENNKILSFFYGLTKHKKNSYPWMLNKFDLIEK